LTRRQTRRASPAPRATRRRLASPLTRRAAARPAQIARRRRAHQEKHPDAKIISLGIGDTTEPLPQVRRAGGWGMGDGRWALRDGRWALRDGRWALGPAGQLAARAIRLLGLSPRLRELPLQVIADAMAKAASGLATREGYSG
jgi:hypothetical protein